MSGPLPFRPEAVVHQAERASRADVLRIAPRETRWALRLLALALAAALAFVCLGRVSEYASGPALVRIEGRTALSASHPALVTAVEVAPGDRVEEGVVLVRLFASEEAAELAAHTREFDDQLLKLLQRPRDVAAREALVSLRTRRELARQRLAQRTIRAPHAGVVADVRVRPGQLIEPGSSVIELRGEHAAPRVLALLPGRYRPLLSVGARLRFELDGFSRRAEELRIDAVGDQVVGPAEAARYLGRELGDTLALTGPVVLVQAPLPPELTVDGARIELAHGLQGKAETAVRSEPIAFVFVPGLKQWVERVLH